MSLSDKEKNVGSYEFDTFVYPKEDVKDSIAELRNKLVRDKSLNSSEINDIINEVFGEGLI